MWMIRDLFDRIETAWELLGFLRRRKLWWLYPLVFLLLLSGILIGAGTSTGVGPFIYTLF
ncbi:MAG: DUF5989 family protein [Chloroflexota bacterium]|uniref:Uncharacterized protein n=1 Tax=marine metagenome TaxID=408172 RepID=A0A382KBU8_9ZZZZ|nr:DUF5989 family protein [Chloroflexota bacterium]